MHELELSLSKTEGISGHLVYIENVASIIPFLIKLLSKFCTFDDGVSFASAKWHLMKQPKRFIKSCQPQCYSQLNNCFITHMTRCMIIHLSV